MGGFKRRKTKEEYQEAVNNGMTIADMCTAFNVSEQTIKENLVLYGIKVDEWNSKYFENEGELKFAERRVNLTKVVDKRTGRRYVNVIDLYVE